MGAGRPGPPPRLSRPTPTRTRGRGTARLRGMALLGFSHVGVCCSDLDRSTAFYRDVLGFRELFTVELGPEVAATMEIDGRFRSRMLARDDLRLELLAWIEPSAEGDGERRPMHHLGMTHLCFRVDDVDELGTMAAAAEAAGGRRPPGHPQRAGRHGHRRRPGEDDVPHRPRRRARRGHVGHPRPGFAVGAWGRQWWAWAPVNAAAPAPCHSSWHGSSMSKMAPVDLMHGCIGACTSAMYSRSSTSHTCSM